VTRLSVALGLLILAALLAGCGAPADASSGAPGLERIGGQAQFWRYHDEEYGVVCYLWGPDSIACLQVAP
jgi:hypothetical protein